MLFLVSSHGYLTSLLICHPEYHHHLTKSPVDFFLERVTWGMNSSKYIMRFWHVQRLQLFSVINPAFYWHAMGNYGRICSSLSQSSHLCWLLLLLFISIVVYDKSLRMTSWGWGAEVWIKICFPYQTDHSYNLFPWWAVASMFENRGFS